MGSSVPLPLARLHSIACHIQAEDSEVFPCTFTDVCNYSEDRLGRDRLGRHRWRFWPIRRLPARHRHLRRSCRRRGRLPRTRAGSSTGIQMNTSRREVPSTAARPGRSYVHAVASFECAILQNERDGRHRRSPWERPTQCSRSSSSNFEGEVGRMCWKAPRWRHGSSTMWWRGVR